MSDDVSIEFSPDDQIPDPTSDEVSIKDVLVDDIDEDTPDEDTPSADESLRYFGIDFDVEGLVRRLNKGDLVIPSFDPAFEGDGSIEGFQRRFVWPKKQMDRFIESLLLGYPVPGIFLVEQKNRQFLVLDGQQRLRTLQRFYSGEYRSGAEYVLEPPVNKPFQGKSYNSLAEPDRRLLDSTMIQATVVVPSRDNFDSVYKVFERINSSGIKLRPQEIRVALYAGKLIHLLRELNAQESWRGLFGPPHTRLKDHELILRYIALTESTELLIEHSWDRKAVKAEATGKLVYKPSMNTYLNEYLQRHRNLEDLNEAKIKSEFIEATKALYGALGKEALKVRGGQLNAAHSDAMLVGMTFALRQKKKLTSRQIKAISKKLLSDTHYREAVEESTSHADNVVKRLELAVNEFTTTEG